MAPSAAEAARRSKNTPARVDGRAGNGGATGSALGAADDGSRAKQPNSQWHGLIMPAVKLNSAVAGLGILPPMPARYISPAPVRCVLGRATPSTQRHTRCCSARGNAFSPRRACHHAQLCGVPGVGQAGLR